MLASVVITRARSTLLDPSPGVYWTDAELISYLNGGTSYIVGLKPDAYVITGAVPLVAGINQALPAGGVQFMDALMNTTSKVAIIKRDLAKLSQANPGWSSQTATVDAAIALPDARDPTRFRVSPPNTGAGNILATYGAVPPALAATTDTILLSDIYETALWAFVVGSAYAKNSAKGDIVKSQGFFAMVPGFVTGRTQMQLGEAPKTDIPDETV